MKNSKKPSKVFENFQQIVKLVYINKKKNMKKLRNNFTKAETTTIKIERTKRAQVKKRL